MTEHQGEIINSYNAINGLFKITHFYYYMGIPVPNAEAAIQSVIDVVLQDSGDTHVCSVYNPWITFELLLDCIEETEGSKRADEVRAMLIENGEALVTATYEKIIDYKEEDGAFSYRGDTVQLTSQKALVACATSPESDVNATCISSTGIAISMLDTFGVTRVPMFTSADYYYFLRTLEDMGTIIKNEPQPVYAEKFDNYEDGFGEEEYGVVKYPADTVENQLTDITQSDGKYKYYQSDVVADPVPSDNNDKALLVKTYATDNDFAANPLYTFISVSNSFLTGNCYKFSGDFMVKSGSGSFIQLLFSRTVGAAYDCFGLDFQMYEENGEKYVRIADYKAGPDGDRDNNLADGISLNTWFNVAVAVYKIYEEDASGSRKLNILGKIFINGEYVGISSSSRVEDGSVVDFAVGAIAIAHSRKSNNELYIDNVKAERTNDAYVAESPLFPVKPEDIPQSLPIIEGTHIGGDYYKNSEAIGKRYNYDQGEKAPSTSAKKDAKTFITSENYVHYYRLGNTSGKHEYITYSYNAASEGLSYPHAVFEADVAFGNANANNFLLFKFYSLGMRAGLYLNASADGSKIEFRNTVYSTEDAILQPNTWYNLRIEVYNFDNSVVRFKIYINGKFVAEVDGLDVSQNDNSRVEIQLQYTDEDSWIAYDNLYLGYIDAVYEELPGIKGPELKGTKDNGKYFNDETTVGKKIDYNALGAQAPSTSLPDVCEVTEGKYVWFHKGGTSTKSITYTFDSVPSDRVVNIIEFDAAFGNIANSKTFMRILMQSGVCRADLYLKTDANGLITIGSDAIVSGENISISQGEWHNYRLEYSLDTDTSTLVDVKLYVDNVWQCDMQFICGTVGNERVLFYLQGDVDYYMCIDNVYLGYSPESFVSGAK